MRRTLLCLAIIALLPSIASAQALDFSDISAHYTDGPFALPEAAGISLLTRSGIVEGNPDGTFRPRRTLNRAEFLTIVMRLVGNVSPDAAANCFPDVRAFDWFAPAVCAAKANGVIGGYPDGTFGPERDVNQAEALKILTLLYDYQILQDGGEWYLPYAAAARAHGTALPDAPDYNAPLTRGQMARLAAAFLAESKGQLTDFRAAESGDWSSSSSSTSSSVQSSSESSVISSSSSTASVGWDMRSRLLMLGQRSQPVADGTFGSDVDTEVQGAEVRFDRELNSLAGVTIVDEDGRPLFSLTRVSDEAGKQVIWRGTVTDSRLQIPANTRAKLGVVLDLKPYGEGGGVSEEFVLAQKFYVTLVNVSNGESMSVLSDREVQPAHQTTAARITGVTAGLTDRTLSAGKKRTLAQFALDSDVQVGANLDIELLTLHLAATNVTLSNFGLKLANNQETVCTRSSSDPTILTCPLTEDKQDVLGAMQSFSVFADVAIPPSSGASPSVQVSFQQTGSLTNLGDIIWSDGSGNFSWVDVPSLPAGPVIH